MLSLRNVSRTFYFAYGALFMFKFKTKPQEMCLSKSSRCYCQDVNISNLDDFRILFFVETKAASKNTYFIWDCG